jgi:hypothetical protein
VEKSRDVGSQAGEAKNRAVETGKNATTGGGASETAKAKVQATSWHATGVGCRDVFVCLI